MPSRGRRLILGLVAVQLGDAAFNVLAKDWVIDDLQRLGFPTEHRHVFPVIKGTSALGLLAGLRWPPVGRLTAAALVTFFVIAMGFHARAKDHPARFLPPAGMLAWSALALRAYRDED